MASAFRIQFEHIASEALTSAPAKAQSKEASALGGTMPRYCLTARTRVSYCALAILVAVAGCDQFSGNRYEITKDQSGRTLRLDKRTGEISVIEGERIVAIRDAKTVDAERESRAHDLARGKTYPTIVINNFGLEATLRTSWQDGKLFYALTMHPLMKSSGQGQVSKEVDAPKEKSVAKKAAAPRKAARVDWARFDRHQWFLILEDSPFELARQTLAFSNIIDDQDKVDSKEAKGSIAMPSETYKRIDLWNVMWRTRF